MMKQRVGLRWLRNLNKVDVHDIDDEEQVGLDEI